MRKNKAKWENKRKKMTEIRILNYRKWESIFSEGMFYIFYLFTYFLFYFLDFFVDGDVYEVRNIVLLDQKLYFVHICS